MRHSLRHPLSSGTFVTDPCSPASSVAIARALVRNPSVLLLDEATSALDSGAESQVNQAISTILAQKNITVILVAHRLSSIAQAETVIVLENGRVTEQGLYADLVRVAHPDPLKCLAPC